MDASFATFAMKRTGDNLMVCPPAQWYPGCVWYWARVCVGMGGCVGGWGEGAALGVRVECLCAAAHNCCLLPLWRPLRYQRWQGSHAVIPSTPQMPFARGVA